MKLEYYKGRAVPYLSDKVNGGKHHLELRFKYVANYKDCFVIQLGRVKGGSAQRLGNLVLRNFLKTTVSDANMICYLYDCDAYQNIAVMRIAKKNYRWYSI
jgi:hypothetical protein